MTTDVMTTCSFCDGQVPADNFCEQCGGPLKPLSEIPEEWVDALKRSRPELYQAAAERDALSELLEGDSRIDCEEPNCLFTFDVPCANCGGTLVHCHCGADSVPCCETPAPRSG